MKSKPVPPVNVRIRRHDGAIIPVDLVYRGVDTEEGVEQHLWVSVHRYPFHPRNAVLVDEMPEHTALVILTEE